MLPGYSMKVKSLNIAIPFETLTYMFPTTLALEVIDPMMMLL